jgi:poly(A) polymerase
MAALQRLHGLILKVSPERVRDELARILTEGGARRGFELLDETGLLGDILPEVAAMKGVAQPPEFHPEGDVWTHTLLLLEKLRHPTVTLAAGALLHDVGKPPTFRWPTASASTGMWRKASSWRTASSRGCGSRASRPSRSKRWSPTTCAS